MKIQPANKGFSILELLVVIAIVALLAAFIFPTHSRSKEREGRITCINLLRSIGIGFRLYATDGAPYPEYQETNGVWQYFQAVGRELGSPKILLCPMDTTKAKQKSYPLDFEIPPTTDSFAHPRFQNTTLSYFFNPDASEDKPDTILSGDRNVSTNTTMFFGMLNVETNTPVQWTEDIHKSAGNILLADGSAWQVSTGKLREQVRINTNGTQRFLIP